MPVVVGTGQRLFEDVDTSSLELTLTDVRKLANSSVILTYAPSQQSGPYATGHESESAPFDQVNADACLLALHGFRVV